MISTQTRKPYLIFALLSIFCSLNSMGQDTAEEKAKKIAGYKLAWSDEFNKDGRVDSLNWRFESGFVRNEELQWYQSANAWCKGGKLVIEARRGSRPNPGYIEGSTDWRKRRQYIEYTSASMNTSGKQSWLYGRFIMRARIDVSAGLWPAWWTLGTSGKWPSNGEIDIMEYYSNKLLANIACGTDMPYKAEWFSKKRPVDLLGGKNWAAKFHTWRMDWDENSIALYVDDSLMNKVELDKLVNKDGSSINPFKQPHYMLLDLAMGGMNGGELGNTKFPNRFEVDYVRVYQKE